MTTAAGPHRARGGDQNERPTAGTGPLDENLVNE